MIIWAFGCCILITLEQGKALLGIKNIVIIFI